MTWEELLLKDMGRMVSRVLDKDVVAEWYEYDDGDRGGCLACGPDPAQVIIAYKDANADEDEPTRYHWYYGSLGELLDELKNQG